MRFVKLKRKIQIIGSYKGHSPRNLIDFEESFPCLKLYLNQLAGVVVVLR